MKKLNLYFKLYIVTRDFFTEMKYFTIQNFEMNAGMLNFEFIEKLQLTCIVVSKYVVFI